MTTASTTGRRSWIFYAALLILFWGVWGAFSALPATWYGYPDEMIYSIWALTMIIPAAFILRGQKWDRRPAATIYGLLIGLTGAGGQLVLFQALTMGPAYLIFPIISISPAITVVMAMVLLRERISPLAVVGLVLALAAIVLFTITGGESDESSGPWLLLATLICVAWGVQAYFMRKTATTGVNEATTFGWMTISGLLLIPVALISLGGLPTDFPWQAPALTAATQVLNAAGALFLVMALARGKASIVAPTTNALAPALTVIISLIAYQTLPSPYGAIAIVLALVGSTLMVYSDEKRGEAPTLAVAAPREHVR
ncbi:membrane protein [Mycolicibacterium murale]|uniref:Membrane protein n=1 Tax=Mycolicibacterium murale TaxID=182220 RepID=A0A7I9WMS2_9MYCO|nr:DMT family transporter [Mycolicibacterium murale]MCV7184617.1 DMT family transporter [Mycolicibacterium murale]GFG59052.1 membrane protein [Mycolicibacterium murale]